MMLSLVLATIGRTLELQRCLESLSKQYDKSFEVLVVDQNPDDRLVSIIEAAKASGVDILHLRVKPAGLSSARNLGISEARGAIVAFPDDDCWYEPGVISAIRKKFEDTPSLQGCVALWWEQSQARTEVQLDGELTSAAWRKFRGGDASSISLFLRKSLLEELNGFDPRLGVGCWYGAAEETDFVMRALAAGAKMCHCKDAIVHHALPATQVDASRVLRANARRRARGAGAIYAKHRLGLWIVLRGVISPTLKPLLRGSPSGVLYGTSVSLGRVEGYLKWRIEEA